MNKLEAKIRELIAQIMVIGLLLCLITDVAYFIYYAEKVSLLSESPLYVLRVVLPNIINIITVIVVKRVNESSKENNITKYWVCSICLCTMIANIAIFHCYYTPLWLCHIAALIFCSVFHDLKLLRVMFIYGMLVICICFVTACNSYPEEFMYYMQSAVICAVVTVLAFLISNAMEEYAKNISELDKISMERELELKRQLDFDPLTNVHSRGYVLIKGEDMLKSANQYNPVTIAVIDVDDFKTINDKYGHDNGDKVLKTLGLLLNSLIDERYVIVGRFSGEEFVFVFNGGSVKEHEELVDALRESFSMIDFSFMGPNNNKCTFSGGITATYERKSFDEVFRLADEALFEAKNKGKNVIVRR